MIYLFLRDHEGFHDAKLIAEELDRHHTNVINHLNDMHDLGVVVYTKEDGTRYWWLNDEIRKKTQTNGGTKFQLDIDPLDFEYDDMDSIEFLVEPKSPETVRAALNRDYGLVASLVFITVLGFVMAMTGLMPIIPDIWSRVGEMLMVSGPFALLAIFASAYKEVHYD